jgi:hypothetical protein
MSTSEPPSASESPPPRSGFDGDSLKEFEKHVLAYAEAQAAEADLAASDELFKSPAAACFKAGPSLARWEVIAVIRERRVDPAGAVEAWQAAVADRRKDACAIQLRGAYTQENVALTLERLARAQRLSGDNAAALESEKEVSEIRRNINLPNCPSEP